jgi:hypothetical protein
MQIKQEGYRNKNGQSGKRRNDDNSNFNVQVIIAPTHVLRRRVCYIISCTFPIALPMQPMSMSNFNCSAGRWHS